MKIIKRRLLHLKDTDFAIYADDNTPYTEYDSTDQVI